MAAASPAASHPRKTVKMILPIPAFHILIQRMVPVKYFTWTSTEAV